MHARLLPTCTLCVTFEFMHIPLHMCAKELPAFAVCVVLTVCPCHCPDGMQFRPLHLGIAQSVWLWAVVAVLCMAGCNYKA